MHHTSRVAPFAIDLATPCLITSARDHLVSPNWDCKQINTVPLYIGWQLPSSIVFALFHAFQNVWKQESCQDDAVHHQASSQLDHPCILLIPTDFYWAYRLAWEVKKEGNKKEAHGSGRRTKLIKVYLIP